MPCGHSVFERAGFPYVLCLHGRACVRPIQGILLGLRNLQVSTDLSGREVDDLSVPWHCSFPVGGIVVDRMVGALAKKSATMVLKMANQVLPFHDPGNASGSRITSCAGLCCALYRISENAWPDKRDLQAHRSGHRSQSVTSETPTVCRTTARSSHTRGSRPPPDPPSRTRPIRWAGRPAPPARCACTPESAASRPGPGGQRRCGRS